MGVIDILLDFVQALKDFHASLYPTFQTFVSLFVLVVMILIYAIFVWKLRMFISRKNIFNFDLNKYNRSENPAIVKIIASAFYLLEYVLIIPFIVFFWFAVFTFFLIFLVKEAITIDKIFLISAVAVASIRICSYIPKYGENLAVELAKILPFTFLGIAVFEPDMFVGLASRLSLRISQLPLFFSGTVIYLAFIVILEVMLRFFEFAFSITGAYEPEEAPEEKADVQ